MKIKYCREVIILGMLVLLSTISMPLIYSQGEVTPTPSDPFSLITSTDPNNRIRALADMASARSNRINVLLSIAEQNINEPTHGMYIASDAIQALGDERAVEAVPFLVKHLTFTCGYDPKLGIRDDRLPPISVLWPCVHALENIGNPSLDPLLAEVETNDINNGNARLPNFAAMVFAKVLGDETGGAYIRQRMEATTDDVKKQRLAAIAKVLEGGP